MTYSLNVKKVEIQALVAWGFIISVLAVAWTISLNVLVTEFGWNLEAWSVAIFLFVAVAGADIAYDMVLRTFRVNALQKIRKS